MQHRSSTIMTDVSPATQRRRVGLGSAFLVMGIGILGSFPPSAEAASNGSWSVYPTTRPGQSSQVVFNLRLTPGKTVLDSVTVANLSSGLQSFNLYAADAFNTPRGGLSLTRQGDPVQGIGSWIRLSHSSVTIQAQGESVVPFVVVVPANARPGDHLGGIVAEQASGTPSSAGSVPINVVQAVGVRVYGQVIGPLKPHLRVLPPQLGVGTTASSLFGGSVRGTVTFRVINDGNVVLTPQAFVTTSGTIGGTSSHLYDLGPILPGESIVERHAVEVQAVGQVRTAVTLAAGGATATASTEKWVVPWALVGVIVIVIAAFTLGVVAVLRRRRKHPRHQTSKTDVERGARVPR